MTLSLFQTYSFLPDWFGIVSVFVLAPTTRQIMSIPLTCQSHHDEFFFATLFGLGLHDKFFFFSLSSDRGIVLFANIIIMTCQLS